MTAIEKTAEQWRAEFAAVRRGEAGRETSSGHASIELVAVAIIAVGATLPSRNSRSPHESAAVVEGS